MKIVQHAYLVSLQTIISEQDLADDESGLEHQEFEVTVLAEEATIGEFLPKFLQKLPTLALALTDDEATLVEVVGVSRISDTLFISMLPNGTQNLH